MSLLQWVAIALSSFSGALFLGFLTAAFPDLWAIHLIATVVICGVFAANGLSQSQTYISYNRGINPIIANFILRAIVVVILYWVVIGVGHWTYTPEVVDEFAI